MAERSLSLSLLSAAEPGRRNRRTADGVLLAVGAFVVGLGGVIAESASTQDEDVEQAWVHARLRESLSRMSSPSSESGTASMRSAQ